MSSGESCTLSTVGIPVFVQNEAPHRQPDRIVALGSQFYNLLGCSGVNDTVGLTMSGECL